MWISALYFLNYLFISERYFIVAVVHGLPCLFILLSLVSVMKHKIITWLLIINPTSWLINNSLFPSLVENCQRQCLRKNPNGKGHRVYSSNEAPSGWVWLPLLPILAAPPETWQVVRGSSSCVLSHSRLSIWLFLLFSQNYQQRQWPNRCWYPSWISLCWFYAY